jgi:hypothetical protein
VLPFSRVRGILDYASDFGNTSFVSEKKGNDDSLGAKML